MVKNSQEYTWEEIYVSSEDEFEAEMIKLEEDGYNQISHRISTPGHAAMEEEWERHVVNIILKD